MPKSTHSERPWYEAWFDSPYYHLLYHERDESEATQFLTSLFRMHPAAHSAKVLDVACGHGRHAKALHRMGYDVTGIDNSRESIGFCNKHKGKKLAFFVYDMRQAFRQDYFDLVLNLFTSFGYFETDEENFSVIMASSLALKKGGFFVLDFLNTNQFPAVIKPSEEKTLDGIRFHITRSVEKEFLQKEIRFTDKGVAHAHCERVRLYSMDDLQQMLKRAGLSTLAVYGDYTLAPFNPNTSERLIFVTRKLK